MRHIESGRVLDHTFSAGHKIETVRIGTENTNIYIWMEIVMFS